HQFIGCNLLGAWLESRVAEFEKVWSTKCTSVESLEGGFRIRIVDQGHPGIICRIEITILVVAHAGVEMKICQHGHVTLNINAITQPIRGESAESARVWIKSPLVLVKVVSDFGSGGQNVPLPQAFGQLKFRAPPFTRISLFSEVG